ncbi:Glycosyl hydrolases family 2, sugar binding domain [Natronincola peptidivorans]|uniref:histidine kinase n=1 Tax=Natronincola peptidivorans TaxID=426128 RepID=A0A1I0CHQ9_9FIRM|nr:sensor histidine kinase [Natronincola peptidivorans]SET19153.1 Glycosyl hydrolases family 2, sugar binding domain [Natronincola peptidivorans]
MKPNKKLFIIFLICVLVILISSCAQQMNQDQIPMANMGYLDLLSWDFEENDIIKLQGHWKFYWEQLIESDDFPQDSTSSMQYIQVPATWNNYTVEDISLTGDGFATYKLRIATKHRNESLGLEIPKISTAYRLWVNNELLAASGNLGMTSDSSIPKFQPSMVFFDSKSGDLELIIQVSNFHHQHGGILKNFRLGLADQMKLRENWHLAFDVFVFGSLFVVGIYHLIFYFYRRKEKSNLFFGSFCIMIGIRTLFIGTMFVFQLFPHLNWEMALKIEYLTFYLGTPLFILYLKSILFQEISMKAIHLSIASSLIFSLLVLFNPVKIYAQYNIIYQFFAFLIIFYLIYALVLAYLRKREGAVAIGLAVIFFVGTVINDILYESSLIYFSKSFVTTSLSSVGFLVFVFSQSIILSRKFTHAFSRIEEMTANLQQLNESLEDKVLERTIALESSNRKLEEAYQDLSEMEQSRTNLLTNISHDLRSPMASVLGYINAILDGIVEQPEQQIRYLHRIKERIHGLNHLTQELFDLTQLESRKLKLKTQVMSIELLMQKVHEKYNLDIQRAGICFHLISPDMNSSFPHPLSVEVDVDRMDRAFSNIIYNAIKHIPEGGTITMSYYLNNRDIPSEVIIKIADNGSGIPAEDLPYVFDRFFTGSKSRSSSGGSGLGLSITKEIVEYHNGRIWATSKPGEETAFYLSLPLFNYHHA